MTTDSSVDALAAAMSIETSLSEEPVFNEHPRFSGYKNVGRAAQRQKERRQEYLDRQKEQRAEALDRARAMFDDDYLVEDDEGEEAMEADEGNAFRLHQRAKLYRRYQDQLMFSEWLIDIPNELHETWAMMACPKGKRCLIVAKDGWTQVFNKAGLLVFESMTGLAGGSSASKHSTTIIDAIRLNANPKVYYILDVIYAQGMSFLEVDALSRFAMVQAIAEEAAINVTSLSVKYRKKAPEFLVPPLSRCTLPAMTTMMSIEQPFEIDGLLFYNDKGWYTAGYTPLVGWLKPWMLPEVLNVPVLEKYTVDGPKGKSLQEFVADFNDKHNHKFVHGKPWEMRYGPGSQTSSTRGLSSQESEH